MTRSRLKAISAALFIGLFKVYRESIYRSRFNSNCSRLVDTCKYLRRGFVTAGLLLVITPFKIAAQPQQATYYRKAAQLYRDAANKSKSQRNRSCYLAHARYHDCLADQLGPGRGRQCANPTCQFEPEPDGGGTTGAAPAAIPTTGSTTPQNEAGSIADQMNEMKRRRDRERAIEEQEREEADRIADLKPRDMTPVDKTLSNALDGKDAVEGLKVDDARNRESFFGSGGGRGADSLTQMNDLTDKIEAQAEDDRNYAASESGAFDDRAGGKPPGGADFYREGDLANGSLYTPFSPAEERGWGELKDWRPPEGADGVPSSITFEKDGITVATYSNRFAIPKVLTFNPDGTGVVEYGPDATHPQGTTIYTHNGQVVEVRGPVDDRVPTTVTYGRDGSVLKVIHGPAANGAVGGLQNTANLDGGNGTGALNQPPRENRPEARARPSPIASFIPPKQTKEAEPEPAQDDPGLVDRFRDWANKKIEQGKRVWDENVRKPVNIVRQCLSDPFECATGLGEATKQ